MKKITFVILLLVSLSALGQNLTKEDLEKEIKPLSEKIISLENAFQKNVKILQSENNKLKLNIEKLNTKLSNANAKLDTLQKQTEVNSNAINETSKELGLKISNNESDTNQKITEVDKSLSKNSLFGIIGVLIAILFSGLLFWFLRKRQKTDKTDLIDQLSKTKLSIEESLVKEFVKQTELMDSQVLLIQQQKTTLQARPDAELDHSLALKVADQIVVIERSVGLMDEKTKGLQRIKNSITNLKDNLSANGYEIPELIGKSFNQGMKIIVASSITDENLKKGEEIITRIVKPQVNFNDKMIQAAQVEVSVGY